MWVQCVSKGQINEPSQEGTGSAESSLTEPYLLAEGIPENLGHEWRILHPFETPGVRFPTDNTPPNERRLAENVALVELIQTTEYLEDTSTWGQRDYQLYSPRYGDPFYRGKGRGRGRGRGRREWLSERPFERDKWRVWKRFFPWEWKRKWKGISFSGTFQKEIRETDRRRNGQHLQVLEGEVEMFPVSSPTEGESPHRTPPTPAPSEDRFFTDWSSIRMGSPLVRTPPQGVPVRERG